MVNVIISQENKTKFKSKNAITKLKKFLKEYEDIGLVSAIEYLKEGYQFNMTHEGDNITVNIKDAEHVWGNQQKKLDEAKTMMQQQQQPMSGRDKLRRRLAELQARRTGKDIREIKSMKKTVDKDIFQRYLWLKQNVPGLPLPKPTEILDEPEKHKEQIELLGSGLMKITGNPKVDQYIGEYFSIIANKIGFNVLTMEQIQSRIKPQQEPQPAAPPQDFELPSNINLSNYVDSDTESESDSEEEKEDKNTPAEETKDDNNEGDDIDV